MSEWSLKRFWEAAEVAAAPGGYTVTLDGRPIKTPAKAATTMPTEALARAVAEEWAAQVDAVDPSTMPMTRLVNSAIDKVGPQRTDVIALLAAYGDNDLLCYRAAGPSGLVAAQTAAWDPLIAWARERFDARLALIEGVMPQPQDPVTLDRLAEPLAVATDFEIAALHDLISLSGSLVIALAVAEGQGTAQALWEASCVDETWQISQWGEDEEASAVAALKRGAFLDAARFFRLCRDLG